VTSGQINDLEGQVKEGFEQVVAELRDQLSWEYLQFQLLALADNCLTSHVIPQEIFWRVSHLMMELRCHDLKPVDVRVDAHDRWLAFLFPRRLQSVQMYVSDQGAVTFAESGVALHACQTNRELIQALQGEITRKRDGVRASASELSGPEGVGS